MTPSERMQALHDLNAREETARAAGIAMLAEGIAMTLFLAMIFVWVAIIGSTP